MPCERNMKLKELQIEARGRVQGVGFRNSIKKYCDKLKLKGFTMNRNDGNVFILVQGSEKDLNDFVSWIHKGPGLSKIEGMNYNLSNAEKEYPDFRIVREENYISDKISSLINLGRFITKKKGRVPTHVAIIPDGNRRWAKKKGFEGTFGHYKAGSYISLENLFKEAERLGVKYMSIWGFSTENWKRNKFEQKEIFDLISSNVQKFFEDAHKNKIRFRHIGRKDRIPNELAEALRKLEKETSQYDKFNIQLCLDYGGRDEIIRAVNNALNSGAKNLGEEEFSKFLDGRDIPDPDLIIRTSGEHRLSGFMPFQSVYSELYFSNVEFPDFGIKELREAIMEYGKRKRRFGGN